MNYSNLFVCLLGMGTVFAGLICLIFLCKLMGVICMALQKKTHEPEQPCAAQEQPPENRQQMIAAISCALAEELGTDVKGLRILSVKRL